MRKEREGVRGRERERVGRSTDLGDTPYSVGSREDGCGTERRGEKERDG